jgi:hypothetical protein
MDSLGKEFLDFLATVPLKEARNELYNLLEAGDDEVNVYYLTPLSNLKSIIADGGIKCRAMVGSDATDISAQEVQKQRHISLKLARKGPSYEIIDKKIHECVNFFWNPLNDTFRAFQRNSLLDVDVKDSTYGIVCILEMGLSAFFETDKVYWSTSRKNLVSDNFSSFSKKQYKQFYWQTIFSSQQDRNTNHFRAAEFIAFYENPTLAVSDLIPMQFIKRILVPAQYEKQIKETISSVKNQIYLSKKQNIFRSKKELLYVEKRLIETINKLQRLDLLPVDKFCELINTFANFKEQLGCGLTEEFFENKDMAHSVHGIEHITRVMFWVHVLCYLSSTDQQTEKVAQYAAFIHDLCRKDHSKDKEHGSNAAKKYEDFLRKKQIPDSLVQSCMNAIIYHCKDDSECHDKDLVWKILKDADSLERGRFGLPICSEIQNLSRGCDINYLRLDIFRDAQLKKELAFLAFRLAYITRYTKWSEDTFRDIKTQLVKSLKASLKNDIFNQYERGIVNKMLRHLSV